MKLCIVGIGGAGGKVTSNFLENVDLDLSTLSWLTGAKYISPGRVTGIWLEADKDDAKNKQHFFKDLNEGGYPGFFIPHDVVSDGCDLHVEVRKKYGYNVKKQGFVRDAQYLKAIFEIFDTDEEIQRIAACSAMVGTGINFGSDSEPNSNTNNAALKQAPNPIFDSAWNSIKPYTILGEGDCDGILFIVSFGGGTGTGFINPIVDHIRKEGKTDFPVFVLGILTEPGDFSDGGQNSKEGQRYLAAISALYDLLTKSNGANGIILIDNQILDKRVGSDRKAQNKFIYKVMKPVVVDRDYPGENPAGQAMEKEFSRGLSFPPIFVPLYWSQPRRDNPEEELVRKALSEGKLFDCTPEKADKAIVFCRGFIDSKSIRQALSAQIGLKEENIWVLRKMGEKEDEILILLRNPYGSNTGAKEGTLENKFCKVIDSALQYMNQNREDLFYEGKENHEVVNGGEDLPVKLTPLSKQALDRFFFGPNGLAFELKEARKRLEKGEKPFFLYPLRIFQRESKKACQDTKKPEFNGLDEQTIMRLVNRRLAELGLIGSDKDQDGY